MSIKRTNAVWENSKASGTQLLLLLALADMATDDGLAWPSVSTLARRVRVSSRSVTTLVNKLERSGEIIVVRRPGHHSYYIVTVGLTEADKRAALQRLAAYLKEPVADLEHELLHEPVNQSSPTSEPEITREQHFTGEPEFTPEARFTPEVEFVGTPEASFTTEADFTPEAHFTTTPEVRFRGTPEASFRTPLIHASPDPLYEPSNEPSVEPSSALAVPKNGTANGGALAQSPAPAAPAAVQEKKVRATKKPKQATSAEKRPSPLVAIIDAYWSGLPAPPANRSYARYMRAAKAIHDAGYTPEQVKAYLAHVYQDEWWRGKAISLEKIAEQLPTWLARYGSEDNTIAYTEWHEPTATPQEMYEALTLEGKMAKARRIREEAARRSAERMRMFYD